MSLLPQIPSARDIVNSAAFRGQIRGALEWLRARPQTPAVRDLIALYEECLK